MKRREFLSAGIVAAGTAAIATSGFSAQLFAATTDKPLKVLALVFDDYETLDLHGPVEMIGHMKNVEIKLVGPKSIIRSYQGPRVVADILMDEVTPCDLFIVPGGLGTRTLVDNKQMQTWLQQQASVSKKVFSICTGSALLATSGLLDGINATTNKMAYSWVTSLSDKTTWHPNARWVDDGRFLTSSGVSAGIDAALFYISQHAGMDEAKRIERLTEYHWNSDASNDPYAVSVS